MADDGVCGASVVGNGHRRYGSGKTKGETKEGKKEWLQENHVAGFDQKRVFGCG